jgi:hypothetical protein
MLSSAKRRTQQQKIPSVGHRIRHTRRRIRILSELTRAWHTVGGARFTLIRRCRANTVQTNSDRSEQQQQQQQHAYQAAFGVSLVHTNPAITPLVCDGRHTPA